ncbi:histidine--tRNA ligase [bacterium]|nr:MAG: histidine--tRNA ligase [bacterium]
MYKRIPGTKDILPQEAVCWQKVEEAARKIFSLYNYQEIRPPLIEEEALFNRSLGASTEIVQKQMFIIKKGKDIYALRPEGTASVVRAYLENSLDKTSGFLKLYYIGPMFRLERPQKGRLRQFHHLGCEVIGSGDAFLDVEVIALADNLLKTLSVNNYQIKINSLGCRNDKKALVKILKKELKNKTGQLCQDCRRRFRLNILRILDCKQESCVKLVRGLNIKDEYLCQECRAHFAQVASGLVDLKIDYQVDPYLVRGLDYYTRTVFEIKHAELGSQDALGAGGRYDHLVRELGGQEQGAIGFAMGIERLLLVKQKEQPDNRKDLVYLITLGQESRNKGLQILSELRKAEIKADTDYEGKSLKAAMRSADNLGARYVVIIGENELKEGIVSLKDMVSGQQRQVSMQDVLKELKC